jgi:hypothetical protein
MYHCSSDQTETLNIVIDFQLINFFVTKVIKSMLQFLNYIGYVMVHMLTSSVVYRGFNPPSGQTKDCKIGICCFSAKHITLKTGWLRIRIMFLRGATCLPVDYCFSEIAL